jgi:hypothetical protein
MQCTKALLNYLGVILRSGMLHDRSKETEAADLTLLARPSMRSLPLV